MKGQQYKINDLVRIDDVKSRPDTVFRSDDAKSRRDAMFRNDEVKNKLGFGSVKK